MIKYNVKEKNIVNLNGKTVKKDKKVGNSSSLIFSRANLVR